MNINMPGERVFADDCHAARILEQFVKSSRAARGRNSWRGWRLGPQYSQEIRHSNGGRTHVATWLLLSRSSGPEGTGPKKEHAVYAYTIDYMPPCPPSRRPRHYWKVWAQEKDCGGAPTGSRRSAGLVELPIEPALRQHRVLGVDRELSRTALGVACAESRRNHKQRLRVEALRKAQRLLLASQRATWTDDDEEDDALGTSPGY